MRIGLLPGIVVGAMVALSAVAYFLYWPDKAAAQRHRQRTPESTLHLLGLAGGWPGALMARRHFRHKAIKRSLQIRVWVTVALNSAVPAWLARSGIAARMAQPLGG